MLHIYNQFRDFHVFKRFKYLLADWWGIDILVVVKVREKFFYDNVSQLNNPIVKDLLESTLFKNYFLSSLNKVMNKKENSSSNPKFLPWKQTGLDLFVVPLVLKDAPLEAFLVATGFASKRREKLYQSLSYLDLSKKAIEQKMKSLKKLSQTDEIYIQKMLRILAEEFFALLQEKKRQDQLIEKLNHRNSYTGYGPLLGKSPAMKYIFYFLEKIKHDDSHILIEGENGTGKRLLGRTIHTQSVRSKKPFYLQNFSTFKGKLLELEFFGYSPRAFPKASKGKKALLEKLAGGTLFLNEIGNTSLGFQVKLLQFLKEGVFFSEGNAKSKKADVRIIATASKDLKTLVEEGQFNEDLYFAISAMTIKVPPLRSRKEDIHLFIYHFLKNKGLEKMKLSSKAMMALYNYSWPGNIRELENEIKKLISLRSKDQQEWTEQDLSSHIKNASSMLSAALQPGKQNLKEILRSIEKRILLECLRKNNWNKTKVAKILGTSRTSVVLKTKEYGILRKEGA